MMRRFQMIKRRLTSVILLLVLGTLIVAYVWATSSEGNVLSSVDQRSALAVQSRMYLNQAAPSVSYYVPAAAGTVTEGDMPVLVSSLGATECQVRAVLDARYEEVAGIAATVYDLDFEGRYRLRYEGTAPTATLEIVFPFPSGLDTLNQVYFLADGKEPSGVQYSLSSIVWLIDLAAGEEHDVVIRYRARGAGGFVYALDRNRRLDDLDVSIVVEGLTGSEVPEDALPTTAVKDVESGEEFAWHYDALIADRNVRIELPTQPGFAQRVEKLQPLLHTLGLFSPLFVGGFVAALVGIDRLGGIVMPSLHYSLAGLGVFLFYPSLTFLSGVIELPWAATVAFVLTTGLLIAFLGIAAGWRRSWTTLPLSIVFLGLFSLGLMSRWRGLFITAGGVVLVGLFMLLVARRQAVKAKATPQHMSGEPDSRPLAERESDKDDEAEESFYCLHCGAKLDEAFTFCPACGKDAKSFCSCRVCGSRHYVPAGVEICHCPVCGERMVA
jgi:hypothetical protein